MFKYNQVDNAHAMNQLVEAGWEWFSFTGDGNWMSYLLRKKIK